MQAHATACMPRRARARARACGRAHSRPCNGTRACTQARAHTYARMHAHAPTRTPTRMCRTGGLQLAVLHPKSLVVYSLKNVGSSYLQVRCMHAHLSQGRSACLGSTHAGTAAPCGRSRCVRPLAGHPAPHTQCTKMYAHFFEHTAANMTYGPFGGARGEHAGARGRARRCWRSSAHGRPSTCCHGPHRDRCV